MHECIAGEGSALFPSVDVHLSDFCLVDFNFYMLMRVLDGQCDLNAVNSTQVSLLLPVSGVRCIQSVSGKLMCAVFTQVVNT